MKYYVPISVTLSSHITVEAKSPSEAIKKARKLYKGYDKLDCPCIDIDFCEDIEDVEVDDGE